MSKKTIEIEGTPIVMTNRLYVSLKAIGQCNAKGKSIMSIGYGGKIIAEPDQPLQTLMIPLFLEIQDAIRYSDLEAAKEDLKAFQAFVADLEYKENTSVEEDAE